jgi:tetratricopeptide (TPR) repeat protein
MLTVCWILTAVLVSQENEPRGLRQAPSDEALAAIEQDSRTAAAYYRKGLALAGWLNYSGAVEAFESAVEIDPRFADAWRQLVVLYPQIGRAADARRAFEHVGRVEELPSEERLALARSLRKAGWFEEAIEALGSSDEPRTAEEWLELGLIESEKGEDARAAEHLERAFGTPSIATAEAEYRYGLSLEGIGRPEEALAAYRRALELDPRHVSSHFRLGNLLLRSGRQEEGRALLQEYETLRQWGRRVNLLKFMVTSGKLSGDEEREKTHALVMLLLQGGELDEAGRLIDAALLKSPGNSDLLVARAFRLVALGERKSAREALQPVLESDRVPSDAFWLAARIDLAEGRVAEAVAEFEKSVAADPDPPARLLEELGLAYASAGLLSAAETALERALAQTPNLFEARVRLGALLLDRGVFTDAEKHLRAAVTLRPEDAEARRGLARALEALGRTADAAAERKAADELESARKRP